MIISLPTSPWFYRCLNAALLLIVAWLAAGLFWLLVGPAPSLPVAAPPLSATRPAPVDVSALAALFGPPAGDLQPSSLNLKLRGVIAHASPAAAIFEQPGQAALAVRVGEEIQSGVRLSDVGFDHVIVDNRGRRERLELDAKPAASGVALAGGLPPAAPPVQQGEPARRPEGYGERGERMSRADRGRLGPSAARSGDDRLLNRQTLVEGMQTLNVADWARGLVDAPGAGIVVENAAAQPLAGPLGLQSGDVISSVNGTPLQRAADISALYAAFSQSSQVQVSVIRNGTPVQLRYRIENRPTP
ncbi:type II secretion system protein N [Chitinimonas sp. BJYL2]|uniref:type II secretion system protein N n=1 Tax=Chitinimonas sp. BJYL2 TaxID=2976696 RepID=UPI0022B43C07|nr:type II secretion system protein N [Chitinimonas sp. BJYL2]